MADKNELLVFLSEEAPAVLSGAQRKNISKVFTKAVSFSKILSNRNLIPVSMVFLLIMVKPLLHSFHTR